MAWVEPRMDVKNVNCKKCGSLLNMTNEHSLPVACQRWHCQKECNGNNECAKEEIPPKICNEKSFSIIITTEDSESHLPTENKVCGYNTTKNLHVYSSINNAVIKAEILWTLKIVMSNISFRSFYGLSALFKCMFPDSKVIENFTFTKDKFSYMLCHGIAPYFHSLLKKELQLSDYYVISLAENTKYPTESEHVEFNVTYWDPTKNRAKTRYLCSSFLTCVRVDDLLIAFLDGTKFLDGSKILQVSMTGPWVNWTYLKALRGKREENNHPKLINIGNCDLHTVHEAFKAGAEKTGWKYKELLKCLCNVLHDTPANRSNYIDITGSSIFPLKFCGIRWIDDGPVAQRAIDIWDSVCKLMIFWESLPKSRQPSSKSFFKLQEIIKDKIIIPKLHFFCYLAKILMPFPISYEKSKPMVPFLHDDLHMLVRKLMSWFIKSAVLCNASTSVELCAVDMHDQNNYVNLDNLNIGFGAESFLRDCLRNNTISINDAALFKEGCIIFLVEFIEKITKHSCLLSSIAKNAGSLNPNKMILNLDACKLLFKNLIQKLSELRRLTSTEGGKALNEYNEFMYKIVSQNKGKFQSFSQSEDRLDDFFFTEIGLKDYPYLSNIIKLVLCLNHGQTKSSNLPGIKNNLAGIYISETSIISERTVQDYMTVKNLTPETFHVPETLITSFTDVRQKYQVCLDEMKRKKEEEIKNLEEMNETSL